MSAEEKESSSGGGFWEQVSTIFFAVLIALGIRAFVIEPYRIPSGSMFPTLLIGDHLFVNKFVYGIKIPFTDIRLPGIREPEAGDVVVFTVAKDGYEIHPADRRPELPRESFVKRIVGIPGDRVEVRGETVWVNGEALQHDGSGETLHDEIGRELRVVGEASGGGRFAYGAAGGVAYLLVLGPQLLLSPFGLVMVLMASFGLAALGMQNEMERSGGFTQRK